jgi:hypothetical protein
MAQSNGCLDLINRFFGLVLAITVLGFLAVVSAGQPQAAKAAVGATITNYYSVCKNGVLGNVSTWHGKNRDGRPPYDPARRTYDFRCPDEEIYSPTAGVVYGVTPKYGGVILVEDSVNGVCLVFLGMKTIAVAPQQEILTGTYMGTYRLFHLSAVDGNCVDANWYDIPARQRERPVQFIEFAEVIAPDIRRAGPYYFFSQNPSLTPAGQKELALFFVSPDASMCTNVTPGACDVAVIGSARTINITENTPLGIVKAAVETLLATKDATIAPFDLINSLHAVSLTLETATLKNGVVTLSFNGTVLLQDHCDPLKIAAQIEETAKQVTGIKAVVLRLNGQDFTDSLRAMVSIPAR